MKNIIISFLICILFYAFSNIIFSNTGFLNNIIFNSSNKNNNKEATYIMEEISRIIIKQNHKELIDTLSITSNNNTISNININNDPIIYIYNTHDKESYINPNKDLYNIDTNVKTASYILQDQLKLYNINSIVEEKSPTTYVVKNNLDYPNTYDYSRDNMINAKQKYPSLNYFIDVHRDGVSKDASTVIINDKSYAKLMFFLGTKHEDSDKNYDLVKKLESYIYTKYPNLLRKTYIRNDSSYNQDLNPNSFLIEVGGNYNTIDEVYNSICVFAESLAYVIGDSND